MNTLHDRIKERLEKLDKSSRRASLDSGLSEYTISKILKKPEQSQTLETIRKLAVGLDTTAEWLAFGISASVNKEVNLDEVGPSKIGSLNSDLERLTDTGSTQSNSRISVDRNVLRSAIVEGFRIARSLETVDEGRLATIVIESLSAPLVDPAVTDPAVSARIFVGLTARGAFDR